MNLIFQIVSSQLQRLMNGASKSTSQTDINNFRIVQYLRAKLSRAVSVVCQSLPNSYYMCPSQCTPIKMMELIKESNSFIYVHSLYHSAHYYQTILYILQNALTLKLCVNHSAVRHKPNIKAGNTVCLVYLALSTRTHLVYICLLISYKLYIRH